VAWWVAFALILVGGCAEGMDAGVDGGDGGGGGGRRDGGGGAAGCDADLATDPSSCGLCGRTCVVPNAVAACVAGECAVGTCDDGWQDDNASPLDGCEAEAVVCTEDAPCPTSCGTTGATRCGDPPTCAAPPEACNLADDDCNGGCDDGAGCRVGVHRSYGGGEHFYTTSREEAACCGYSVEAYDFFWLYAADPGGLRPLFRCNMGGRHFYTTSTSCEMMGGLELTVGFIAADARCGAIPLYRLHHAGANDHFYTVSAPERDSAIGLGYTDRGIVGYVWSSP
jgi:hypothetical protein